MNTSPFAYGTMAVAVTLVLSLAVIDARAQTTPNTKTRLDLAISVPRMAAAGVVAADAFDSPSLDCQAADAELEKPRSTTTPETRLEAAKLKRVCLQASKAALLKKVAQSAKDDMKAGAKADGSGMQLLAADAVSSAFAPATAAIDETIATEQAGKDFLGMTFGIGMGFSHSRTERITEATVAADGTLRVTGREKQVPRVILEAHYYGVCTGVMQGCNEARFGVGPFFGLAATGDVIDAFALGIMFGRKDPGAGERGGFSLGIGAVLDRQVKNLAKGFEEGKPLPAGETAVVFEKRSKWSPLLFFTRTF